MQAALDSTALMLAKDLTDGHHHDLADQRQGSRPISRRSTPTPKPSRSRSPRPIRQNSGNGSTILVNGSGNIDTDFMKVAGFPTMDFNTSSTSAWGNVRMRVAHGARRHGIDERRRQDDRRCKPAAKSLIDQIERPRQESRRHLHLARSVRQGRQCRRQQRTTRPGSTGSMWDSRQPAPGHVQQFELHEQKLRARTTTRPGRQESQHLERLRHRPRPGLRYQEHDADLDQRADHGSCAEQVRSRCTERTADWQCPYVSRSCR